MPATSETTEATPSRPCNHGAQHEAYARYRGTAYHLWVCELCREPTRAFRCEGCRDHPAAPPRSA